ncbi:MAG: hypothetical protein LBS60_10240 [Deltaproteobacteria bacterium]|jgi:hypothetical protein|nr:hypothetical protein [Deltaproteobacteria bacterium]
MSSFIFPWDEEIERISTLIPKKNRGYFNIYTETEQISPKGTETDFLIDKTHIYGINTAIKSTVRFDTQHGIIVRTK